MLQTLDYLNPQPKLEAVVGALADNLPRRGIESLSPYLAPTGLA